MKYLTTLVLLCAVAAAHAEVANEAVRVLPGGKRVVEEPPGPRGIQKLPTPISHWHPGVRAPSYVIETDSGLKECGWAWVSEGCRDYKPGRDTRERTWVVKHGGRWLKCPRRDSATGCTGYYEPSVGAQQD